MRAEYETLLKVINVSVEGTNCDSATFSNIPTGATGSASDCLSAQP